MKAIKIILMIVLTCAFPAIVIPCFVFGLAFGAMSK